MTIQWTERMNTGHPVIDTDHRQLVEIINLVEDAVIERNLVRADHIMFSLLAYVTGHFAREEALQRQIGFPDQDTHKQKHAIMAAFTRHLEAEIAQAADDTQKLAYLAQLQDALGDWLVNHILDQDMKMVPYLGGAQGRLELGA